MATHSNVLAWRIPGTGEPGGLPSTESHRFGHDGEIVETVSDFIFLGGMNFSREKIHSFHHILKEFYRPEKNKIKDGKQLV